MHLCVLTFQHMLRAAHACSVLCVDKPPHAQSCPCMLISTELRYTELTSSSSFSVLQPRGQSRFGWCMAVHQQAPTCVLSSYSTPLVQGRYFDSKDNDADLPATAQHGASLGNEAERAAPAPPTAQGYTHPTVYGCEHVAHSCPFLFIIIVVVN